MPTTQLDQLKQFTTVVADTGDFESMKQYQPRDATTNPSLILAAASKPEYVHLVDQAVADRRNSGLTGAKRVEDIIDHVLVNFGSEMHPSRRGLHSGWDRPTALRPRCVLWPAPVHPLCC